MTVYHRRTSILEPALEYRAEADALVIASPTGERRLPWRDVREIRLTFAPTEQKVDRYVLALRFAGAGKVQIDNMHWRGVADFENRSESYRPFALAVAERVARLAPGAKAAAGAPFWSYALQILAMAVPATFLVWLLLEIGGHRPGESVLGKVLYIAWALPIALVWMVRGRPRKLDLNALPDSVLPPVWETAA